ncbi:hypothetical protein NDR87_09335 [Nocardia sp. CDC159]|uniref:Uncharacterized protein n=1 Tax=Nocardia pulmonis TaxID=2951408 RepID=A0A9X2E6E3_9NOCA|nr:MULTISPECIES: hypothetical protein [Nocardia]MCM6773670.1 hypothetical protein [Nocardia pulmonis]MCM6786557.1 hypothetical protein [Nocardia sp. CDC159]
MLSDVYQPGWRLYSEVDNLRDTIADAIPAARSARPTGPTMTEMARKITAALAARRTIANPGLTKEFAPQ